MPWGRAGRAAGRDDPRARAQAVAGKLDLSKLGFAEKASVRMAHASEGDYRDWQAIDDWAAAIAQQRRIGAGGPDARA